MCLWRSEDYLGSQFCPYTTWVPGTESSGLAASAFTPEPAYWLLNLEKKNKSAWEILLLYATGKKKYGIYRDWDSVANLFRLSNRDISLVLELKESHIFSISSIQCPLFLWGLLVLKSYKQWNNKEAEEIGLDCPHAWPLLTSSYPRSQLALPMHLDTKLHCLSFS